MANTALNRTTQAILTNKSGGAVAYGAVVIIDTTTDSSFTTTTTSGLSTSQIGLVLEPNGIANNAAGMVAVGGWAPRVTLNTAATRGQFIKSHTVAGQGTPHSSPQVEGDFAVALEASTTPAVTMFGSPNGPLSGGTGTVTHTAGALTANAVVVGNASADITVLAALGASGTVLTSNGAGVPPSFTAPAASGALVLLEQHTASSSAELDFTTCITSTYDEYQIEIVGLVPANTLRNLILQVSTNGGSSYDTGSNYSYAGYAYGPGGTGQYGNATGSSMPITGFQNLSNNAQYPQNASLKLFNPLSTSQYKVVSGIVSFWDSTPTNATQMVTCSYKSTTAVNAFRILFDAGNITSGTVRVYGIAK